MKYTLAEAIRAVTERIENNLRDEDGCRVWYGPQAETNEDGYGLLHIPAALIEIGWPPTMLVHVAACRLHSGPPPDGSALVRHLCNRKRCCHHDHIRWGTHTENTQDFLATGMHSWAKLTPDQVREIRSSHAFWVRCAASQFAVTEETIRRVVRRESWKDLPDQAPDGPGGL